MSPFTDFKLEYYIDTDHRFMDITGALQDRIKAWLFDPRLPIVDRVKAVTGVPGIGRSWFLHFIQASSLTRTSFSDPFFELDSGGYSAIYIDLKGRIGDHAGRFSLDLKNRMQEVWEETSKPLCLCVDNVPENPDAELDAFEKLVLFPCLEKYQGFVLLALDSAERCGLSARFPLAKPFWPLETFKDDAANHDIFKPNNPCSAPIPDLAPYTFGHPGLAQFLCKDGVDTGIKDFVTYWMAARGIDDEEIQSQILTMALPLSLISLTEPDAKDKSERAWEICGLTMPPKAWGRQMDRLRRLGWVTLTRSMKYRPYVWDRVIQGCLQHLFKTDNPGDYSEIEAIARA